MENNVEADSIGHRKFIFKSIHFEPPLTASHHLML